MIRPAAATLVVILATLLAPAPRSRASETDPAAPRAYDRLMQRAHSVLSRPLAILGRGRLPGLAERLAALPRDGLTDGEWIDLHVVLSEIHRRLDPQPLYAGRPLPAKAYLRAIPSPDSLQPDPLALLDTASALHALRSPPGARPPRRSVRKRLALAARRAAALAKAAAALEVGEDALATGAAFVLREKAEDLTFDLRCRTAGRVPAGRLRFAWLLTHRHRLRLDADRSRAVGEAERKRALAALRDFADRIGDGRTWQELTLESQEDHLPSSEALLAFCRETSAEALALARRSGLVTVPDLATHLEVRLGDGGQHIPYAQYRPGGRDDRGRYHGAAVYTRMPPGLTSRARTDWLRDRSRHNLRLICAHEGVPGHHLQFAVASGVRSPYRKYGFNTLYVEGWGLYSEELVERMGWLDDPRTRLAWLRMKLWRAIRVIVDVGIHDGSLTPGAAARMLADEALLDRRSAEMEVMRHLATPTQALSYLLGYRRIVTIRRAWIALHGPESERDFHDRFLGLGCVPLDLAAAVLLDRRAAYDRYQAAHERPPIVPMFR